MHRVVVFGSVARDEVTVDSDLYITVNCDPFAASRQDENIAFRKLCCDVDPRIETVALHTDDLGKPYFALPREVEREGVVV